MYTPRTGRRAALALAAVPLVLVLAAPAAQSAPNSAAQHPQVVLEPDAQAFADAAAKNPPIYTLSYANARKALDGVQSGPVPLQPADISHRTLNVGPTGQVTIRIVRPQGVQGKLPVVMYFHGGGWVLGDEGTHDRLVREIANGAHAAVIFVDYTPSPRRSSRCRSSRRTPPPSGSPSTAARSTSTAPGSRWPATAWAAT